jgi:hypothetical protein
MARRARRLPARRAHRARLAARLAGAATLIVGLCFPPVAAAGPSCTLEGEELRCSDGRRFPVFASPWEGSGGRAPALSSRGSRSLEDPNSVPEVGGPDGERLEGPDGLVCVTHRGHVHCNR